jgi:hypothetical protein
MKPGDLRQWRSSGTLSLVVEVESDDPGKEAKVTVIDEGELRIFWLSAFEDYTLPLQEAR